jgi:hypothetical protein
MVDGLSPMGHRRGPLVTTKFVKALLLEAGSTTEPLSGRLRLKLLTCSRLLDAYELEVARGERRSGAPSAATSA